MSSFVVFLVLTLFTVAICRPEVYDKAEARDDGGTLDRRGATDERNPIVDYLLRKSTNELPPGSKREFNFIQAFPDKSQNIQKPNQILETSKPNQVLDTPKQDTSFQRDPSKSPYDNFSGYILAGRKPEQNLVKSPVLNFPTKENITPNRTYTRMETFPATATVIQTYDEKGTLRSSYTRYEPAGSNPSATDLTRQQLNWPYAGYFPILIKDPFLTAYNAFTSGGSFSFSSLVEYGPEADICRAKEGREEHEAHLRKARSLTRNPYRSFSVLDENYRKVVAAEEVGRRQVMARRVDDERTGKTTKITVADQEKGMASIRLESPRTERDSFFQAEDIEARAKAANLIIPPLSSIVLPPLRGFDERKKKPAKPEKEESSEEENVGEEQEESSSQEPTSDGVAINPPPEGSSVAEAKPVGLAIAGPGGVAASKPVAQAIVGPGGLAIARPVATAIAGVEVEGQIPLGGQQKKPQKKKPKQEYDNDTDELQYVGGLSGPIGKPKPKHTPPETNYIGGLRGVVGNPIPKFETPASHSRQAYQFRLGSMGNKYGFLPFPTPGLAQGRTIEKRMDNPTYFHGMLGSHGPNMPASVYPLVYYQ